MPLLNLQIYLYVMLKDRCRTNYAHEEILNIDQVGLELELELYSSRTLSYESEKVTMARVSFKNALDTFLHNSTNDICCWKVGWSPVSMSEGEEGENELVYCLSRI